MKPKRCTIQHVCRMIYIYILSAHICIYKHTYHHHMCLFHNTNTCKIFTWTLSSISIYVLISKQVKQYLLLIWTAFDVCTHDHIIWETLKNYITSSRNWNFLYCIDVSILNPPNTVLYTYICSQHSSCLFDRYIFSVYIHIS